MHCTLGKCTHEEESLNALLVHVQKRHRMCPYCPQYFEAKTGAGMQDHLRTKHADEGVTKLMREVSHYRRKSLMGQ